MAHVRIVRKMERNQDNVQVQLKACNAPWNLAVNNSNHVTLMGAQAHVRKRTNAHTTHTHMHTHVHIRTDPHSQRQKYNTQAFGGKSDYVEQPGQRKWGRRQTCSFHTGLSVFFAVWEVTASRNKSALNLKTWTLKVTA